MELDQIIVSTGGRWDEGISETGHAIPAHNRHDQFTSSSSDRDCCIHRRDGYIINMC